MGQCKSTTLDWLSPQEEAYIPICRAAYGRIGLVRIRILWQAMVEKHGVGIPTVP